MKKKDDVFNKTFNDALFDKNELFDKIMKQYKSTSSPKLDSHGETTEGRRVVPETTERTVPMKQNKYDPKRKIGALIAAIAGIAAVIGLIFFLPNIGSNSPLNSTKTTLSDHANAAMTTDTSNEDVSQTEKEATTSKTKNKNETTDTDPTISTSEDPTESTRESVSKTTPESSSESPTPVPSSETPTPVPSPESPTPVPSSESPTPVPSSETPTPVPSSETPTPVPSSETPTPVPSSEPTTEPSSATDPTSDPVYGTLPKDFVRRLVHKVVAFKDGYAGYTLQAVLIASDWVNQVGESNFTSDDLQKTVKMAYDELSADEQFHFDNMFHTFIVPSILELASDDPRTIELLEGSAGGEHSTDHWSVEEWKNFITALSSSDEAPTNNESTTESSSHSTLAKDFVRQLVFDTAQFPRQTAGHSLKSLLIASDWLTKVSISNFSPDDLKATVDMALLDLTDFEREQFKINFQGDILEDLLLLAEDDSQAVATLEGSAGGEHYTPHLSVDEIKAYVVAIGFSTEPQYLAD